MMSKCCNPKQQTCFLRKNPIDDHNSFQRHADAQNKDVLVLGTLDVFAFVRLPGTCDCGFVKLAYLTPPPGVTAIQSVCDQLALPGAVQKLQQQGAPPQQQQNQQQNQQQLNQISALQTQIGTLNSALSTKHNEVLALQQVVANQRAALSQLHTAQYNNNINHNNFGGATGGGFQPPQPQPHHHHHQHHQFQQQHHHHNPPNNFNNNPGAFQH